MPFNPEITDEHVESIRRIVNVFSASDVKARILAYLNQSGWTEILADIPKWDAVKDDFVTISGDGVKIDNSDARLEIRNRVRVALGLPETTKSGELVGESQSASLFGFIGNISLDREVE